MSTIHFNLSNVSPAVLFGGNSVTYTKMFFRVGEIEDIDFEVAWQEMDTKNTSNKNPVRHTETFTPSSCISPFSPESKTHYEFSPSPIHKFANNINGITLTAFSKDNKPFDLDIHVVITENSYKK